MYPYQQQQPYSSFPPQQGPGGPPPPPPGGYGSQLPSYPPPPPPTGSYPYQQQQQPAYSQPQGGPGQYPPQGGNPYGNYPPSYQSGPYGNQATPPPPPQGGNPYGNPPPPGYPAGVQSSHSQSPSPYGAYGQQPSYGGSNNYNQPLNMTIMSATNLKNVEIFGKQDPYIQFSTTYQDAQSFQKTSVADNAGTSASWNQSFTVPAGAQTLYIEVMDKERTGFDEVIGFAAIPLQQAYMGLDAMFEIYSSDGKSAAGEVRLIFGQQQQQQQSMSRGQTYVDEGHAKRVKSLKNKAVASDVAVGGALAIGAGLLAKHFYNEHEEKKRREEYGYDQYKHD